MGQLDDELFGAALQIEDVEDQNNFVHAACADDPVQAHRVLRLLKTYQELELEKELRGTCFFDRTPEIVQEFFDSDELKPGDEVGRYTIEEKIGEGGMCVVYRASQTSPLQRQVALKALKPGMDSQRILARFALERQVLTHLQHPGVTRILDAGMHDNGRPYFVMELVRDPIWITDYCQQNRLDVSQRIELMISVCSIVQYAHQRGIIHRDLKPSNILLETSNEREVVPKVIDFGIAKLTLPGEDSLATITSPGDMFGTPAYMSPEQARYSGEIDIRSDVYSLGVILYELLTGQTPFSIKKAKHANASWKQSEFWELTIPKPSAQSKQPPAKTSGGKHAEQAGLSASIRHDLDLIVLKALSLQPELRYQTVAELQRDLENYQSGRPVEAVGPDWMYRLRKVINRHWRATVAFVVTLVAVLASSAISTIFAVRATSAEAALRKKLDEVLLMQSQLTTERDTAEKAKRHAQALVRFMQVRRLAERAVVSFTQSMLNGSTEQRLSLTQSLSQQALDLKSIFEPHSRLVVAGDWSWANEQLVLEITKSVYEFDSRDVAEAAKSLEPSERPHNDQPDSPSSPTDMTKTRASFQELLLAELDGAFSQEDSFVAEVLDNLGLHEFDLGQLQRAEEKLRRASQIWQRLGKYPARAAQTQLFLTEVLLASGQEQPAAAMLSATRQVLDEIGNDVPEAPKLEEFYQQLNEKISNRNR